MTKAQRAAQILGIDLVKMGRRYAYYADETSQWYWVSAEDMNYAAAVARAYDSDRYSHWCAGASQSVVSPRTLRAYGR